MKLLDRHIFASVALTSLAAVGVLTFIMMLVSLLRDLLGYVMAGQLPFYTFVHLVVLTVPYMVCYALPMGILTRVLLVLGRMSADREITAIRAAGVSVAGISAPIFFFALLGTAAGLAVNFYYMPRAQVAYVADLNEAVNSDPLKLIVPRTFLSIFKDKVIYVGEVKGKHLTDIWVWDLDKQKRVEKLYRAENAEIFYNEPKNIIELIAHHAIIEARNSKDPEDYSSSNSGALSAEVVPQTIPLGKFFRQPEVRTKLEWRTFTELMTERHRLLLPDAAIPAKERDKQRIKIQTVIQEKCATAFAVLAFALLGVPLGIKVSRKETSANFGVAVALVLVYYLCTIAVKSLENQPDLRPDLLMWIPNIAFQSLGVWMFRKADRS